MSFKDLPPDSRPREKLLARGAAALSDTELLAIVLRTGTAGRSVMALAADLLRMPGRAAAQAIAGPQGTREPLPVQSGSDPATRGFGGLAALLQASNADLTGIKGLGPAKRAELLAIMELAKRALAEQLQVQDALQSPAAVRQYIQAQLGHLRHEVFAVLFLDSQLRLIAFEELFRGTLTQTSVYPREIALRALQLHAHAVILAHNHPSGALQPSQADVAITQRVRDALELLDVRALDHIIVTQGGSLSLAEKGLL